MLVKKEWMCEEGMVTLNPSKDYDCFNGNYGGDENQHMWCSIYYTLLKMLDPSLLTNEDRDHVKKTLHRTQAEYGGFKVAGLYHRHGPPYPTGPEHHGVSHDEMNGIAIQSKLFGLHVAEEIVKYGKKHGWAFIDERPYTHPIKNIFSIEKGKRLFMLGRIRQPRDRAFYKMCNNERPSIVGYLHLLLTAWITSRKPKADTSGKILAFTRFQALKGKYKMFDFMYKIFRKNLIKTHGENFLEDILKIYFRHSTHPFHEMAKQCRGKY